jgi:Pro-kumamolisin, activation domain/Abnormal spindle-like microcephaly-assoc'd, ASPM-SPD-2-Hydin
MMETFRAVVCSLLSVLAIGIGALSAAGLTGKPAANTSEEPKLVRLSGNTHPMALPKYDLGLVERALPMERMLLVLKRSPQQEAALEKFMAQQYNPKSPNFHHWLHAKEFGEKYGPSDSDIATVTGWLQQQGFRVDNVSNGRVTIEFSGTATQVEQAFHLEMHRYLVKGVEHIANDRDPQIPEALASVVTGVASLHNFFPKPQVVMGHKVRRDKKSGQTVLADGSAPVSQFNGTDGNGIRREDITPFDFATIYNLLPLWNAGITGSGVTIAISAGGDVNLNDVKNFRSIFGLPANPITVVHNGADPGMNGYQEENTLDVEWSGAAAPGAQIVMVVTADTKTTGGFELSDSYIVDNEVAPIMSASYGTCELNLGSAGNSAFNAIWQQGAAEGISIFESSGDQGSTGCENSDQAGPNAAQTGLEVNGMASSPFVTAVGGTDFLWQNSPTTYWNPTNSSNGSNALGYIPEIPWNSTCASLYLVSISVDPTPEAFCNDVLQGINYSGLDGLVVITGGSGGVSACTTPTGSTPTSCAGGYAKPSWQAGTGVPKDGKRDVPDVSLFASAGYQDVVSGSAYLICISSNSPTGTCAYDPSDIIAQEVGGTSASSPAMAGIMALVLQKVGVPQGLPNPVLYSLAAGENLANCNSSTVANGSTCIFYDTTFGTNAQVCISGTINCVTKTSGDEVGIVSSTNATNGGYNTTTGYDMATGLGSVNATNLVNAWAGAIGKVTLSPTSLTFASTPVGTASAPQTVTLKNSSGILSINGIGFAGTNASSYSGTTTCPFAPTTIAAGASCTVSITFTPASSGTLTAQLEFFDNTTGEPQVVNLTGTGGGTTNPPVASLTPASLAFASTKVGATSAAKVVTLKNTGGSTLNINAGGITITGTNASSFTETATSCGSTLAAAASCTISVAFKPTVAGSLTATLGVADNAAGSPQTVSLSGTATAATGTTATLTPATVTFASTKVGATSAAKVLTLKNTGTSALTINSGGITITGTNASSFAESATTCGSTLAAGATCTISVTFSPTAAGALTATLSVADNATTSPQTAALKGTATAATPTVSLTPKTIKFPNTKLGSTSTAHVVTLKNTGSGTLTINSSGITITGTGASSFTKTTTCGTTVAAGASCTISVSFKPATGGTLAATLNVADNATGSPQTVALSGTVPPPIATLAPRAIAFTATTVGTTSAAKVVTLKNTGGSPLTINAGGIKITGTNASSFAETTTCGSSVTVGGSCTISVTFKPTVTGALSASLGVTDNAAGSPQTVTLTGTGK